MPVGAVFGPHLLEQYAGETAAFVGEFLGNQIVENRDVLVDRILLLPRGRLHLVKAAAHDHFDVLAAKAPRRAAAIHRGIAAAEHDHAPADLVDVPEGNGGEPVNANMDVGRALLPARNLQVAAARRAGTDEHRVVAFLYKRLEALDALPEASLDPETRDVADFLVDDLLRQPEARDLAADHAPAPRLPIEQNELVAQGREVACNRQRGGTRAHESDPLAIALRRHRGQTRPDVALVVGRDALEAADRDRLLLDPAAPASRLARPVAGAAENSWKNVGLPVDHISIGITPCRDQPNIFRNRRMRWARPLAVHNSVEILGVGNVGRLQTDPPAESPAAPLRPSYLSLY